MLSNAVAYREPETYSESLQCAEREEWKRARAAERKALHARGVMSVVPTPVGVKSIKSRMCSNVSIIRRMDQSENTRRNWLLWGMVRCLGWMCSIHSLLWLRA